MPGGTPYITPQMLTAMPASISWNVIPQLTASAAAQAAQLADVCRTATSEVDRYCRQPLRAAVVVEEAQGPGMPRVAVSRQTGIATLITRRRFISSAVAVQVSAARAFPPAYTLIPAGQVHIPRPMITQALQAPVTGPSGGQKIEVAPGYVDRRHGPGYWRVLLAYIAGWPHASLTAPAVPAQSGQQVLQVDDVTGWAGFTGFIFDGPATEAVDVVAVSAASPVPLPGAGGSAQAGPGTVTLAQPLQNGHGQGVVVTALPQDVIHAAVLSASAQALEGIDAIATQALSGQMAGSTGAMLTEMENKLDDYRNWT